VRLDPITLRLEELKSDNDGIFEEEVGSKVTKNRYTQSKPINLYFFQFVKGCL